MTVTSRPLPMPEHPDAHELSCDQCEICWLAWDADDTASLRDHDRECGVWARRLALRHAGLIGVHHLDEALSILRETDVPMVLGPSFPKNDLTTLQLYAPDWAASVAFIPDAPRQHRVAMIRRLLSDPVAASMLTSHPDSIAKLLGVGPRLKLYP